MPRLGFTISSFEQPVVIFKIEVMRLDPYAGNIERVYMCRKPTIGVVNIGADILGAGDDLGRIAWHLIDEGFRQARTKDFIKRSWTAVDPVRAVFLLEQGVDRRVHTGII